MEARKDHKKYPLLRNLQFSPIKEEDEQYVVLWDASKISSEKLILPLNYFFIIQHFDGEHSLEDVAALYLKRFGEFLHPGKLERLVEDLDAKVFLEGGECEAAKETARVAYRALPVRKAAFSGKNYAEKKQDLLDQIESFFVSKEGPEIKASTNKGKKIRGMVAPHYDMRQAGPIYAWAYKELKEALPPSLFVILGTCHTGLQNAYALTDKDFDTPLGTVRADQDLLDRFRRNGRGVFFDEEMSHEHEHSIEFQLPFLQHAMGPEHPFTILPVLCAFSPSALIDPEQRETRERIESFLQGLQEVLASANRDACIVASAELAHIGMRYGDSGPPTDFSFHRCMQSDLEMLKHAENVEPDAFAQFIAKEQDQRRIWGFAPIYTLLRLIGGGAGQVLRYDRGITDQYNSTVTYASMAFF